MAREMKDSGIEWIGFVPANWEVRKVKQYYNLQTGFTPDTKKEEYYDDIGGYDWVNISDIQDGNTITETKKKISKKYVDLFSPIQIPTGSLMFSFKLSVGQTAFAGKPLYSNEAIASFLPSEMINLRFLRYSSFMIMENAEINIYNARILNRERINNAYIVFPPLNEQLLIADYLDIECTRIDSVIAQTRASIEEYKKLKQAVITQAVTKGIRPNRQMKDSGIDWIGDIPTEWFLRKTKALSERIVVGVVVKPADYYDENGTVPFLRGINVKEYCIQPDPMVYISEETNNALEKSIVHKNDLLVVRDGSIGITCVVPEEYDGANVVSMIIVTCKENAFSPYLCYSFNSDIGKRQFDLSKIGSALTHTSVASVSDVFHILPSIEEQKEIVTFLNEKTSEINTIIEKKTLLLSNLDSYKKSLIYEYVTGKKEVPA